jgi:hypothetical protein
MFFRKILVIFVFCICLLNVNSFASDNIITEEDIKIIQNDSIVPRRVLFQSREAIQSINKKIEVSQDVLSLSQNDIKNPYIATAKIALLIMVLLSIIQIIFVILGKITAQELLINIIKALIMNLLVVAGVVLIISISNSIAMFYNSIGLDFATETMNNLMRFVTVSNDIPANLTKEAIDKIQSVDYSTSTLSPEGFCLKTIQDQYRIGLLILNWVYIVLVYLNWLILLLSEFVLTIALIIAPCIGVLYIFGERNPIINKYWSVVLEAAATKLIFFLLFSLVVVTNLAIRPALTQSGINIEYGLFSCMLLILTIIATIRLTKLFNSDNLVTIISNRITTIKEKIQQ